MCKGACAASQMHVRIIDVQQQKGCVPVSVARGTSKRGSVAAHLAVGPQRSILRPPLGCRAEFFIHIRNFSIAL